MSSHEPVLGADDLVTGEAVALDLPVAGLATRTVSGLIDLVVTAVVLVVALLASVAAVIDTDDALVQVAVTASLVTALLVVPTTVETLTRGRTLGKWALGLRTVRADAGPITFQHAFVRALVGVVEVYLLSGAPAFFSALLSPRGQRLGDHAAGTFVVRERVRLVLPTPPAMPAPLAPWARTADISSLPGGLALAVRQFLARAGTLDPGARREVGDDLAAQVRRHLAPPPPPGTTTEDLLAAVVAERRARDSARLTREADLRRRLTAR